MDDHLHAVIDLLDLGNKSGRFCKIKILFRVGE